MSKVCTLTTVDNPFNPFTQFDEWFRFDNDKGYYSCSRLARIIASYDLPDDLSEAEENEATERAVDEIIKYDFTDIYKKVYKEENNQSEGNSKD